MRCGFGIKNLVAATMLEIEAIERNARKHERRRLAKIAPQRAEDVASQGCAGIAVQNPSRHEGVGQLGC